MWKVESKDTALQTMHNVSMEKEFQQFTKRCKTVLKRAEGRAKREHLYTNRTGNLERSTVSAPVVDEVGHLHVLYGAGMFYASYVEGYGYFDVLGDAWDEAQDMIKAGAEHLAKKASK